jgi:DtxR family Mn-dependent transcriptional regulator
MSESEEMYLITLAKLAERGVQGHVPLSALAAELTVLPVSANQMVHKLQEEGVVDYQPYKGVALRAEGLRRANRTLRRRRLWELFLVDKLALGFAEADRLACRLEHLGTEEATERLDLFLDHPQLSPQGLPIPAAETDDLGEEPLTQRTAGRDVAVKRIDDEAVQRYLAGQGVSPGMQVRLLAISTRGAVLLEANGARFELAAEAAKAVITVETSERNLAE